MENGRSRSRPTRRQTCRWLEHSSSRLRGRVVFQSPRRTWCLVTFSCAPGRATWRRRFRTRTTGLLRYPSLVNLPPQSTFRPCMNPTVCIGLRARAFLPQTELPAELPLMTSSGAVGRVPLDATVSEANRVRASRNAHRSTRLSSGPSPPHGALLGLLELIDADVLKFADATLFLFFLFCGGGLGLHVLAVVGLESVRMGRGARPPER